MNRRSLLSIIAILLVSPVFVSAQDPSSAVGGLTITPSTYNPTPGQKVTLTLNSYTLDANSANIVWTAGGQVVARGVGVVKAEVTAPKLGSRLNISVTATAPDGSSLSTSIVLSSGYMDLIIESDGYVPPFFRGKIAPGYQNTVKIIAVPHIANSAGVEYDPKTLVYSWQQESKAIQNQSGYGRQSITIPGNIIPRPYVVTVTASTRDGSVSASGAINVEARAPSLAVYRNDPLYGPLFNRALGSNLYLGTQRESGVLVVPYGFNTSDTSSGGLSYEWLINGRNRPELSESRSTILRSPDTTAGSSNISLTVSNPENILQQAQSFFSVVWSAATPNTADIFQ